MPDKKKKNYFGDVETGKKKKITKEPKGSSFFEGEVGSLQWLSGIKGRWSTSEVKNLQEELIAAGYDVDDDGVYDNKTMEAHRRYLEEGKPGTPQWMASIPERWSEDQIKDLREFLGFPREKTASESDIYSPQLMKAHAEYFKDKEALGEPGAKDVLAMRRKEMAFGLDEEALAKQDTLRVGITNLITSVTGMEPSYENIQFYFGKYASDMYLSVQERYQLKSEMTKQKMAYYPGITESMEVGTPDTPGSYEWYRSRASAITSRYEGRPATDEEVSMIIRGQVPKMGAIPARPRELK